MIASTWAAAQVEPFRRGKTKSVNRENIPKTTQQQSRAAFLFSLSAFLAANAAGGRVGDAGRSLFLLGLGVANVIRCHPSRFFSLASRTASTRQGEMQEQQELEQEAAG